MLRLIKDPLRRLAQRQILQDVKPLFGTVDLQEKPASAKGLDRRGVHFFFLERRSKPPQNIPDGVGSIRLKSSLQARGRLDGNFHSPQHQEQPGAPLDIAICQRAIVLKFLVVGHQALHIWRDILFVLHLLFDGDDGVRGFNVKHNMMPRRRLYEKYLHVAAMSVTSHVRTYVRMALVGFACSRPPCRPADNGMSHTCYGYAPHTASYNTPRTAPHTRCNTQHNAHRATRQRTVVAGEQLRKIWTRRRKNCKDAVWGDCLETAGKL